MTQFKLEVGKKYIDRGKRIVTIIKHTPADWENPFVGNGFHNYRKDGRVSEYRETDYDLISEHIEEPMAAAAERYCRSVASAIDSELYESAIKNTGEPMKEEIKLEAGRKYDLSAIDIEEISDPTDPCTFIYETSNTYYFIDDFGLPFYINKDFEDILKLIKESTEELMKEDKALTSCCNAYWNVGDICSNCNNVVSKEKNAPIASCDICGRKLIINKLIEPYIEECPFCNSNKKEVKLEVGKKYNIPLYMDNPHIFIADKKKFGFEDSYCYLFFTNDGDTIRFNKEDLEGITEHREMIKYTFEGWRHPPRNNEDSITVCKKRCYPEMTYGRVTFEQLPEPESKEH